MADLQGKFCRKPFEHFEVHSNGSVSLCCYTWLPHHAGILSEYNSIHDVFNSPKVQQIRRSIHDGSFSYCNHDLCPHIQNKSLPDKSEVEGPRMQQIVQDGELNNLQPDFYNLCYDESCNLECPSCRTHSKMYTSGPEYEKRKHIQDQIIQDVFEKPHNRNCTVNITGSGDPFGSKLFRELLFSIDGKNFPKLNINLQTNGVMFSEKYWNKMHKIHSNINTVVVSFDAGTKETYDKIRVGGDWDRLQHNMEFLSRLRAKNEIRELRIDFVVQSSNYRDMPKVINIGKRLNVDKVYFGVVVNWGTWSQSEFEKKAIYIEGHNEYPNFMCMLNSPIFDDSIVDLGNVTQYREIVHG